MSAQHRSAQQRGPARSAARRLDALRRRLRRPKVAFVLSGGGNLGAVQAGMLRALYEHEITPDVIVGCSVGAINGAAFAAEPNQRGLHRLERIWSRMADGDPDIMPNRGFLPLAVQLARKGESLHSQDGLKELLESELLDGAIDDLTIPFSCVATDIDRAEEHWFQDGPLLPALLASSALPGIFPPVQIAGRLYYDGGVVREVPIPSAVELGATKIYLLHPGHLESRASEQPPKRPFDVLIHAYWTARANRLQDEIDQLPEFIELIRLPAGSNPQLRFDDFSTGRELAALAYEASSRFLETGETSEPVSGPSSLPSVEEDLQLDIDQPNSEGENE